MCGFLCVYGLLVTIADKAESGTAKMSLFVALSRIKLLYVALRETCMPGNVQNRGIAVRLVGLEQN